MSASDAARRRDLLLTLVMLGILATPAWLTPGWFAGPWLLAVAVLAGPAVWLSWRHAPWVPTPADERPRILAALELSPGQRFCDLGAGDGRVVQWVRQATGADCTGIEASPLLVAMAWLRLAGDGGARVRLGDLYAADLSSYDVLYVWGTAYSVGTPAFAAMLRERARPGARVVSYHTRIAGLRPVLVDEGGQRPLYVYVLGPVSGGRRG